MNLDARDLLIDTLRSLTEMQGQLRKAVDGNDSVRLEQLLPQLAVLERRRNRLAHQVLGADQPRQAAAPPLRDQILAVLRLLGRPSSIRLIADVARARFGEAIPTGRIASLRRDEERSWIHGPGARPAYVVPPLSADRFAPVRAQLALSAWSLEVRIVGPASPRVDALRVLERLIDEYARAESASWSQPLEQVVWRLAATVPGAVEVGGQLDVAGVRSALQAELAAIEPDDARERRDAAERARNLLDDQAQLFGAQLRVVEGGLVAEGSSA